MVESRDGFIVVKNGEVPLLGEFTRIFKVAARHVDSTHSALRVGPIQCHRDGARQGMGCDVNHQTEEL